VRNDDQRTACIDIGGTGIKAMIVDRDGKPLSERVRIETPRPAVPDAVLEVVVEVARKAGEFDRIACGFPGVVEAGVVRTAPNLDGAWGGYRLESDLEFRLGRPARVANDADVHGLAVIEGKGVEMVLTLGTGMGSALYVDGHCAWNLELGHLPSGWGTETYEMRISDRERKSLGKKKWRRRVIAVVERLAPIFNFRRLYLGGGNATRLDPAEMPPYVVLVDNDAGILGGVKLWQP
jgi:polyphosphate glucokinase